jgi:hypothetical protein
LGDPAILQVGATSLLGWIFFLILFGWIGGGMYFRSVAWLSMGNQDVPPMSVSHAIGQTILLSISWMVLFFLLGVPVFLVLAMVLQFSAAIANLLILFICLVSMWVIVPLFFWPHGIFIKQQNVIAAMLSSLQMMRFTLPTSSLFVLTVFLLTFGLNFLWNIPSEDSWMMLLGIFGQSFVATALLAASFVYYRDMNIWLQNVIEKLRPNIVPKV